MLSKSTYLGSVALLMKIIKVNDFLLNYEFNI